MLLGRTEGLSAVERQWSGRGTAADWAAGKEPVSWEVPEEPRVPSDSTAQLELERDSGSLVNQWRVHL